MFKRQSIFRSEALPSSEFRAAVFGPNADDGPTCPLTVGPEGAEQPQEQPQEMATGLEPGIKRLIDAQNLNHSFRAEQSVLLGELLDVQKRVSAFWGRLRQERLKGYEAELDATIEAGRQQTTICAQLQRSVAQSEEYARQAGDRMGAAGMRVREAKAILDGIDAGWSTRSEKAQARQRVKECEKTLFQRQREEGETRNTLNEQRRRLQTEAAKLRALEQRRDQLRAAAEGKPFADGRTGLVVNPV
jgi:chromosome segregation ATPase